MMGTILNWVDQCRGPKINNIAVNIIESFQAVVVGVGVVPLGDGSSLMVVILGQKQILNKNFGISPKSASEGLL